IIDNEKQNQGAKNRELVRIRLKELVYTYPDQIVRVLQLTGIVVSTLLPPSVLYTIVLRHLSRNSELRDAIGKMLLELDSPLSANGQGWQLFGGVLSTLGSVLSGIGRSQGQPTSAEQEQALKAQEEAAKRAEEARKRAIKRGFLIGGISLGVILLIILVIYLVKKAKAKKLTETNTTTT